MGPVSKVIVPSCRVIVSFDVCSPPGANGGIRMTSLYFILTYFFYDRASIDRSKQLMVVNCANVM